MQMPENTSRLRHAIDKGESADKVAFPDPAAAPLGTDAEAGGRPPTGAEASRDRTALGSPARRRGRDDSFGIPVYVVVAGATWLAILAAVALAH